MDIINFISIVISIGLAVIAYRIFKNNEKDVKVVDTVEFYPPEGMNSAELGFYYYGSASSKSVISLLIYLASKGYLKIEETKSKDLFSKKEFKIIKLKEYDGDNEAERIFFEGLFTNSNLEKIKDKTGDLKKALLNGEDVNILEELEKTDQILDYSTEKDLKYSFYKTIEKVSAKIGSEKNKRKAFDVNKDTSILLHIMIIFMLIIISVNALIQIDSFLSYTAIMSWPILFFANAYILMEIDFKSCEKSNFLLLVAFEILFFTIEVAVTIFLLTVLFRSNLMCLLSYIVASISSIIIFVIIKKMPNRTEYGYEILGKIEGFKKFLNIAEKSQLEQLVNENPTYFYDILPYTYVLGVSKKWMKKFEVIGYKEPDWFEGYTYFNIEVLDNFMTNTMSSIERTMTSNPEESYGVFGGSDSGGFSGGGFSGGGSGGGGGGSW